MPLTVQGKALDHSISCRSKQALGAIAKVQPNVAAHKTHEALSKLQDMTWPELKNHPALAAGRPVPSVSSHLPVLSDTLPEDLLDGTAESVQAIDSIVGPQSVLLLDGATLTDIDVIICCTGSRENFSTLMPAEYDPANETLAPDAFAKLRQTPFYNGQALRLYRNFMSIEAPHSLAFLGYAIIQRSAPALYDLITMALAQMWSGAFPMPEHAEMEDDFDKHVTYLVAELNNGHVGRAGLTNGTEFEEWLNRVAGTGVDESLESRCFVEPGLYKMVMDGVDSPHVMRLLDTERGRKAWNGARRAIEKANEEAEELGRLWRAQHG